MLGLGKSLKLASLGMLAALAFGLLQPQAALADRGDRDWRESQRYERHERERDRDHDRDRHHYRDRDRDRDRDGRHGGWSWHKPGHGQHYGFIPRPPFHKPHHYGHHNHGHGYAYGHGKRCHKVIRHGYWHGRPAKISKLRCYNKHGHPYYVRGRDNFVGFLGFGFYFD